MITLHTAATPNGHKISMALEELGLPYTVKVIDLAAGEQKQPAFLALNPNGRIPVIVDHEGPGGGDFTVFESGAILIYLAEKFGAFLPTEPAQRAECLSWLFWQVGSAPFLGGGFGHFYAYAPVKLEYAIDRYAMEVKRQMDVLDRHLAEQRYLAGDDYTIADMAIWPWYGGLVLGQKLEGGQRDTESLSGFVRAIDDVYGPKKDLILMDNWLPDMSGIEVMSKILTKAL